MPKFHKKSQFAVSPKALTAFEKKISEAFGRKREKVTKEKLLQSVLLRIRKEERSRTMRRDLAYAGAFFASLVALFFSWNVFRAEIVQSGFIQLASLFLSDTAIILTDWRNFVLSILEALPVVAITALFSSLWLAILFLKYLVESLEKTRFFFNGNHSNHRGV